MGQRQNFESFNNQPPFGSHGIYPNQQPNTSIALFHIPNDATNSLYVDGIPNDASEREVSRNVAFI